jgi:glycine/D-amino acid oxidase-like deaminating enzyme
VRNGHAAAPTPEARPDLPVSARYDAVIVGGGWFGCRLAQHLRTFLRSVLVLEQGDDLLQRASYNNQARVHQGYHYPRSLLTALRSRVNFGRFIEEYPECVDGSFTKYYAVSRIFSHVTARQFRIFCERIGAPIEPAPAEVRALFDRHRIEDVFHVQEWAFDAVKLKHHVARDLAALDVEVRLQTRALRVSAGASGGVVVDTIGPQGPQRLHGRKVFNCTYSGINHLLGPSGLPAIPLKHEGTEMALVEAPDELRGLGITVMCGPFFSIMPFPPLGLHTLSHVRYTPHHAWEERDGAREKPRDHRPELVSEYDRMVRDAERYLPALRGCRYKGSLWEVKTVLPASETDDSRPILFRSDHGLKDLVCIMGGKIDNVYDALQEIDALRGAGGFE